MHNFLFYFFCSFSTEHFGVPNLYLPTFYYFLLLFIIYQMYAEALHENERLKSRLQDSKQELVKIRSQLEKVTQVHKLSFQLSFHCLTIILFPWVCWRKVMADYLMKMCSKIYAISPRSPLILDNNGTFLTSRGTTGYQRGLQYLNRRKE